jgi:hypothetical protein
MVPAFVLATDESDLLEPPSPVKRNSSNMAHTGALQCLAMDVGKR